MYIYTYLSNYNKMFQFVVNTLIYKIVRLNTNDFIKTFDGMMITLFISLTVINDVYNVYLFDNRIANLTNTFLFLVFIRLKLNLTKQILPNKSINIFICFNGYHIFSKKKFE